MSLCIVCKKKEARINRKTCNKMKCIRKYVRKLIKPDLDNSHIIGRSN